MELDQRKAKRHRGGMDDPWMIIIGAAAAGYVLKLWLEDYRTGLAGKPHPKALPGATPAGWGLALIGIIGALLLVAAETAGEYALGVSAEQTNITWLFLAGMVAAGFIEEVVFRGFFVVDKKGRAALLGSIVGFSLLFALLHYQYYLEWPEEDSGWLEFTVVLNAKSFWTLLILVFNSLWFYYLRFMPRNRQRSLLPCFAAHVSSNLGVFIIKLAQGHVTALY